MGELILIGVNGGTLLKSKCGSRVAEDLRRKWFLARLAVLRGQACDHFVMRTDDGVSVWLPDVSVFSYSEKI